MIFAVMALSAGVMGPRPSSERLLRRLPRTRTDEPDYPMAQIFSSITAYVAAAPATRIRFSRALAPATRLTSREGTPSVLATSLVSAALASPSLAAALAPSARGVHPIAVRCHQSRRARRAA
jgi:hypothetical protein